LPSAQQLPIKSPIRVIISKLSDRHSHALALFQTSAFDRVQLIKSGLPARYVKVLSASMHWPIEKFCKATGLVRPTVDRKIRGSKSLNQDESERVMGIARLVGQAQSLVQESGEADEFDASRWVGDWLQRPLPALGGMTPGEFMDTVDGRALISDMLAQQQSAAFG
jgi:putative toxin-antitoxin system antitoxin component (TIGR02293 family)